MGRRVPAGAPDQGLAQGLASLVGLRAELLVGLRGYTRRHRFHCPDLLVGPVLRAKVPRYRAALPEPPLALGRGHLSA
jgi:hypothetical protein